MSPRDHLGNHDFLHVTRGLRIIVKDEKKKEKRKEDEIKFDEKTFSVKCVFPGISYKKKKYFHNTNKKKHFL